MRRGWYRIEGVQDGDRTLAQQVLGLDGIDFRGKTVLELASAEGLMSKWMIERGAKSVDGIEIVAEHVKEAWRQCKGLPCGFDVDDLNLAHAPRKNYDIVMALAILHKVKDPSAVARRYARCCKEMVIRLPPENAPNIIDPRSGNVPYRINDVMTSEGFNLLRVTQGHLAEWTAHYARND